jgi:hypothetical protein
MQSETLTKLLPCLLAAQREIENPTKGKVNPAFKSGYADLATVLECVKEPLASQGLQLVQIVQPGFAPDGAVSDTLVTILYHISGEYIRSAYALKPAKADPQGVGSAITYARRYSIMAMLNLAAEDDVGNAASGNAVSKAPNAIADKMRDKAKSAFPRASVPQKDDK